MPQHGTWKTTGSSSGVAVLAVTALIVAACIGLGVGVARAVPELLPWMITAGVLMSATVVAYAVVALRIKARAVVYAADRAQRQETREALALQQARQAAAVQHERALEIAAASAPKIVIGSDLIAAAAAGAQLQPQRAQIIQGQVQR